MSTASMLLFLDFGGGEIIIILLVIMVVLGPDKIPAFAKRAGEIMRFIRKATDDIKEEINKETEAIQKPIKSAYSGATAFAENAQKAVKATLDDIKIEEEDSKETKTSGKGSTEKEKQVIEEDNNKDLNTDQQ